MKTSDYFAKKKTENKYYEIRPISFLPNEAWNLRQVLLIATINKNRTKKLYKYI